MKDGLTEQIKSHGHWRINFVPKRYSQRLKGVQECRALVEKNAVHLRGWDYPHFPRRTGDDMAIDNGDGFAQGWVSWENHIEFWRMYESGQFIHYLALREDWMEEQQVLQSHWADERDLKRGEWLTLKGTLWQITEIFEFLSRLTKEGIYDEGVNVSIKLNKTRGRELTIEDPGRIPFSQPRKTEAESINYEKDYAKEELLDVKTISKDVIRHFFDRFGWDPPEEQLDKDQKELYGLRIGS